MAGESIVDRGGAFGSLQLRGRDSAQGTVVFATESLLRDVRGYRVLVERDDRVPTAMAFDQSTPMPYPVALDAGATGSFTAALTPACGDDYRTRVVSADAELDAETGPPKGIERSVRGQRWIRVVLDVTNVTVQGSGSSASVCQAFSGNFAGVELRLDADGTLTAPVNDKSFEQINPGTTGERVHVFAVDADARSLSLVGPGGEALGSWTLNLPQAPGES